MAIFLSFMKFSHPFIIMTVFKPLGACLKGKEAVFGGFYCFVYMVYTAGGPRFFLQGLSKQ